MKNQGKNGGLGWRVGALLMLLLALTVGGAHETLGATLPELRQALTSADGNQRRKAVETLGVEAVGGAAEVVPLLLTTYRNEDHDSFGVKAACARALGATGHPQAAAALGEIAADRDYWVRRTAVEALAAIPGAAATELLVDATGDADRRVREAALLALGGRAGGEKTLLAAAQDADPKLAAAALESLVVSDHPRAAVLLERGLAHASWTVRYRAASLLARQDDPRGFETLAAAVRSGEHAGAALREASCVGPPVVALLVELYAAPEVAVRGKILDILEGMDCGASTDFFADLAGRRRADPEARVRAAMVLYDRREGLSAVQVEDMADLLAVGNDNLSAVALQVLLERGGAGHLPRIVPLLQHDNKVVRHFALANVKRYGGVAYEDAFVAALGDRNGANVRMALEALGEVGTARSLPAIRALVDNRKLRRYALAAAEAIEARNP